MYFVGFIRDIHEKSISWYGLIAKVNYLVYLQELFRDLPFLPEKRVINDVTKLLHTFHDNVNYTCQFRLLQNTFKDYNACLVGKVNCKDNLAFDYSKFYKNEKVFRTTSSPSFSKIQVLGIVFP